jgi:hypothetical protein
MNPYDDNTTRNTIDGRGIGMTNWDFHYINNHRSRLISNAAIRSTHDEVLSMPDRRTRSGVIGICIVAVVLFVLTFEVGLFDDLYLWIVG